MIPFQGLSSCVADNPDMAETSTENGYAHINPFVSAELSFVPSNNIFLQQSRAQKLNSVSPSAETFHELAIRNIIHDDDDDEDDEDEDDRKELQSANFVISESDSDHYSSPRPHGYSGQLKLTIDASSEVNPLGKYAANESLLNPAEWIRAPRSLSSDMVSASVLDNVGTVYFGCADPTFDSNRLALPEIDRMGSSGGHQKFHGGDDPYYSTVNAVSAEAANRTACPKSSDNFWCGASTSARIKKLKLRRKLREPRFCFQTLSDVDVLDDGYKWRKYGQKVVKNTYHPRSYYRCSHSNCRVKKRVERLAEDPRMVITTYEGRHTHSPVNGTQSTHPDFPNSL